MSTAAPRSLRTVCKPPKPPPTTTTRWGAASLADEDTDSSIMGRRRIRPCRRRRGLALARTRNARGPESLPAYFVLRHSGQERERILQSRVGLPAVEAAEGSRQRERFFEASAAGQAAETHSIRVGVRRRVPARHLKRLPGPSPGSSGRRRRTEAGRP